MSRVFDQAEALGCRMLVMESKAWSGWAGERESNKGTLWRSSDKRGRGKEEVVSVWAFERWANFTKMQLFICAYDP